MNRTLCGLIFLGIFCGVQLSVAQGVWEWQNPLPQGSTLIYTRLWDNGEGVSVGCTGAVLHTTDSGVSWQVVRNGSWNWIGCAEFLTPEIGWINPGRWSDWRILATTDGGRTWAARSDSMPGTVNDLHFFDELNGIACGNQENNGMIWTTTDGGTMWTGQVIDSVFGSLSELYFLDGNLGWVIGSVVAFTPDAGITWEILVDDYNPSMSAVQFLSEMNGFGLDYHAFYATRDGGQTWTESSIPLPDGQFAMDLKFTDIHTGWIIGSGDAILATTNGGASWQTQTSGINELLYDLDINNSGHLVAVGENGKALHSSNNGQLWTISAGQAVTISNFFAVDFADLNNGWAVGGNWEGGRVVAKTNDGGVNWVCVIDNPDSTIMRNIAVPDANHIWISGDFRGLWHSTDDGETWSIQTLPNQWYGDQMQFFNVDSGWTRTGNQLAYTTDSGQEWHLVPTVLPDESYHYFFLDMQNGWTFGGKPATIYYTDDGGMNWTQQYRHDQTETAVQDVWFSDPSNGWAAVWGAALLHTTNGGEIWNEVNPGGLVGDWVTMGWSDAVHGWVISDYEPVIYTADGGTTWLTAELSGDSRMLDCDFVDSEHGWLVGWHGMIQTWNAHPNAVEPPDHAPIATQIALSAYPNPFNPQTTLSFTIPQTGRVQVSIYDLTGRLVQTLTDRVLSAGTYSHAFDGRGLPTGMYFVRLNAAGTSVTKKIVLLR